MKPLPTLHTISKQVLGLCDTVLMSPVAENSGCVGASWFTWE